MVTVMKKSELRKQIKERKRLYTEQQLHEMSQCVVDRLMHHSRIVEAKTVMMYYSLPDEVDTHEAVDMLVAMGKKVVLPVVVDDENMVLRTYRGRNDLKQGTYNIYEPAGEVFTDYGSVDVVVVPGVGFDTNGNRLGRGKGYYDRFLSTIPQAYRIGMCFDFQKVDSVPTDANDVAVNEVL